MKKQKRIADRHQPPKISLRALSAGLGFYKSKNLQKPDEKKPKKKRLTRALPAPLAYLIDAGVIAGSLAIYAGVLSPLVRFEGSYSPWKLLTLEATTLYELCGGPLLCGGFFAIVLFYAVTFRWFIGATIGEFIQQRSFFLKQG